jgi:hypothetical protein
MPKSRIYHRVVPLAKIQSRIQSIFMIIMTKISGNNVLVGLILARTKILEAKYGSINDFHFF